MPVVHMRCRMTASLWPTAIVAFLAPMRLPRASPQVFNALGRADRLASNRRLRTMPSPHLVQAYIDVNSGTVTISGAANNTWFSGFWISPYLEALP